MTDFDTERTLQDFRTSSFPERRKLAAEYDALIERLVHAERVLKEIKVFGQDNIEYGDTCAEMAEAYFNPTTPSSTTGSARYSPNEHAQRCDNCGKSWTDHKGPDELCPTIGATPDSQLPFPPLCQEA